MATKKKKQKKSTLRSAGPETDQKPVVAIGAIDDWKAAGWADANQVFITIDTVCEKPGMVWDAMCNAVGVRVQRYLEREDQRAEPKAPFHMEVYALLDGEGGLQLEAQELELSADETAGFGPFSIATTSASTLFEMLARQDLDKVAGCGFAFHKMASKLADK